eukprot:scaffold4450_cov444-Prasinococcus_capsulatus_cf.AAC.1
MPLRFGPLVWMGAAKVSDARRCESRVPYVYSREQGSTTASRALPATGPHASLAHRASMRNSSDAADVHAW